MRRIASTFGAIFLRLALGIAALCASALPTRAAELENGGYLRTTYSIDTYWEEVGGNIRLSTLDVDRETGDSWHYNESLKIDFSRGLSRSLSAGPGVEFVFSGRHTTDELLQRTPGEAWMVNEVRLRLTGENYDVGIGDLSAFFSNYAFNNAFFGAEVTLRPAPWLSVSVLGGINRDAERDTYRRAFGGARVELKPSRSMMLAAFWVHTEIVDLERGSSFTDYENDVWSISSRISLMDDRLVLSGEWAASLYTADRSLSGTDIVGGNAAWCALSFTPLRNELSFLLAYEYVEPDFIGVMGAHSTDRETLSAGVRYTPSEVLSATAYFRWFHDRLTDSSIAPYRTDTMDPGLTVTFRPFFYDTDSRLQHLALELSASLTRQESDDAPPSIDDERIDTRLRVSDTHGPLRWAVYYGLSCYDDLTDADFDTRTDTVGVELGYRAEAEKYTITADLLGELRMDGSRDAVRGRVLDTAARFVAGATVVFSPVPAHPTRCSARYEGIFWEREAAADTREHALSIGLEQVLFKQWEVTGTIGLHGRYRDVSSSDPDLSYTETVLGVTMSLEF